MVFINRQAKIDLDNLVTALLEWEKITLSVAEVMRYVDDIVDICYQLDKSAYHQSAKYKEHLKYGTYSYPYRRNKNTIWYIIYNIDTSNTIFINKIISNYLTVN
jgi:hypothetical protein